MNEHEWLRTTVYNVYVFQNHVRGCNLTWGQKEGDETCWARRDGYRENMWRDLLLSILKLKLAKRSRQISYPLMLLKKAWWLCFSLFFSSPLFSALLFSSPPRSALLSSSLLLSLLSFLPSPTLYSPLPCYSILLCSTLFCSSLASSPLPSSSPLPYSTLLQFTLCSSFVYSLRYFYATLLFSPSSPLPTPLLYTTLLFFYSSLLSTTLLFSTLFFWTVRIYIYTYDYVCMYACMDGCMCICMYVHMYVCICMCAYVCAHMYACICMCAYVCIFYYSECRYIRACLYVHCVHKMSNMWEHLSTVPNKNGVKGMQHQLWTETPKVSKCMSLRGSTQNMPLIVCSTVLANLSDLSWRVSYWFLLPPVTD